MKILLLEDDHLQAKWLQTELSKALQAQVRIISTELEFRSLIAESKDVIADIAIFDVIVRWKNPEDPTPRTVDAIDGPSRAGLRCARLFRERYPITPMLFYSVLSRSDLAPDIVSLEKDLGRIPILQKEAEITPLLDVIREQVRAK